MIFIYENETIMFININIKKGSMKALFLGIFALVWFWYQATNAGYVDWLYVWENAKKYTSSTEWKAWSSLFKALKWTMTDKAFADKYGKPIDMLLNEYLPTAPSDKKWLFQVLSALNKDLLNQISWNTNQNKETQESKKEAVIEKLTKKEDTTKQNVENNQIDSDFDYEKETALKYIDKSSVLPSILKNINNEWNKFLIKWAFEGFVEAYKDIKWMNDSQAIKAADAAFKTIYSYVKVWDVEWTLKGYVNLRDRYNIQRSRSEWGWQWANYTWVHWNGACYGKLRLSMLMLYMAWHDNMQMWEKDYWTDHIQLKIAWFNRYFDAVGAARFNIWQHIWEQWTREQYQSLSDNIPTENTTPNYSDTIGQDVSDKSIKWDISWGSFEGVNEFDFSN